MRRLIVDGNNLANRVWKAEPILTTAEGKEVSTIFGTLRSIKAGVEKFQSEWVGVTWDGYPKCRLEIFPEYKAKRFLRKQQYTEAEQAEYQQFKIQCDDLMDILPLCGVHQYQGKNIEADDIISLLVKEYSNDEIVILSEDQDFLQLVSKNVAISRPMAKQFYTLQSFSNLVQLSYPQMYLEARFIMGDKSDEIPGVPGFKEKRVYPLIRECKTASNVLLAAKRYGKGKLMQGLAGSVDIIARNMLLMDLKYSKNYIDVPLDAIKIKGNYDEEEFKAILLKYQFYSFMHDFKGFVRPFSCLS